MAPSGKSSPTGWSPTASSCARRWRTTPSSTRRKRASSLETAPRKTDSGVAIERTAGETRRFAFWAAETAMSAIAKPKTEPILSVMNIEVIYDHVILVLRGVSLDVQEGQIVALLGANGAGKTTTLKAISNLLLAERGDVTNGQILYKGERIDRLDPAALVKRGICQVIEGRHCFQHLTVEENLLTGAYTRGYLGAGIREELEKV